MSRNSDQPDPTLVVDGKSFVGDLSAQIPISICLGIAYFEFIVQTVLILYVFFTVLLSKRKAVDIFFVVFGCGIFVLLRVILIPVLMTPLPFSWTPTLPEDMAQGLFYFNMIVFAVMYGLSISACLYFIIRFGITRKKMKGIIQNRKTGVPPMVVILMPIYNEEPEALARAVESAIRCDYPAERKHVFLAFDDEEESPLFFALLRKLRLLSREMTTEIEAGIAKGESRLSLSPEKKPAAIFPPRLEWIIEGVRVTICRFPHGGKSPTQGKSFGLINEIYGTDPELAANTLVMFIDSDIILHDNSIHNFVVAAIQNPKIKGITGLVTCRTSRKFNFYQYLQDAEYVDGQMFVRTAEAMLGSVSCLPGALTLIRLSALQEVAPKYFIEFDNRKSVDFHRYHLGEDRYMTYLLTELSDGPYQVTFVSSAQCKTDAPDTFAKLLKQRRRWFLGGLTNDICMLSSPLMWRRLPFMTGFKMYFYSTKGVDWLVGVLIVSLIKGKSAGLFIYLIFGAIAVRYALLCIVCFLMSRKKICIYNLALFVLGPIFHLTVTLYSIWTWNVRSWGGPRTDNPEDSAAEELSKVAIIKEVMKQPGEERRGQTRKSLKEIKTVSRLIDSKLRQQQAQSPTTDSNNPPQFPPVVTIVEVKGKEPAPIQKFVPFPYEMEFLGGGDLNSNLLQPMPPGSPGLSRSKPSGSSLKTSSSMPDLGKLDENYLLGKLNSGVLERAASFRLDTDYLAQVEHLTTFENSMQRNSSFNSRLSGRSSPASCYSRAESFDGRLDGDSDSGSLSSSSGGIIMNIDTLN